MGCESCGNKKGALGSIIEGWGNYLFPSKEVENLATVRALICATCPSNKLNICIECTCPIPMKTRSTQETCDKWKK